jgi:peptide/nickel transport system ATP-binding protein
MALLEVRDLNVRLHTRHGATLAVRGLDFELDRGQTLGLIGESGCGKSLTALALMGLLPEHASTTGSILLDGLDLVGQNDSALQQIRGKRIGMIFQEPMTALNPVHCIGHQVAEPLRLHQGASREQAKRQALALLERVGISDAARRFHAYPHQFSGGQRQRITIAMALACGPDLLIADEPTTALDVTVQRQILDLIGDLVIERQMALLLISHDLGVVAQNAARMLVMYGGRVVEGGPSEQIFARMAHPYTRGLFAARPRLGAHRGERLPTIPGTVPPLHTLTALCPFATRCDVCLAACATDVPAISDLGAGHTARCLRLEVTQQEESA